MPRSKRKGRANSDDVALSLFKILLFLILLVITTIVAVCFHDNKNFHFIQSIHTFFASKAYDPDQGELEYNSIDKAVDWFTYMDHIIETSYYNDDFKKVKDIDLKVQSGNRVFAKFWTDNVMMGVPSIRQIRVKEGNCILNDIFNRYFSECYGRYEESNEDTRDHWKGVRYYTAKDLPFLPFEGTMTTYRGPGYIEFLSNKGNRTRATLQELKNKGFVDRGTRLVLLEIVFYNLNTDTFVTVRLGFEKLATGGILPLWKVDLLPVDCINSLQRGAMDIYGSIYYGCIVYTFGSMILTILKKGIFRFLRSIWSWLIMVYLVSSYFIIFLWMRYERIMDNMIATLNSSHQNLYLDEHSKLYLDLTYSIVVTTVAAWLRLFRFIGFNRTMLNFSVALKKGYADIVGFSIMFFIVFIAFAVLGLLLFSKSNPTFATFSDALVTMMRMTMTDFQYEYLEKADEVFGPLFFICYVLFVFFILLNTFLAVISDSYITAQQNRQVRFSMWALFGLHVKYSVHQFVAKLKFMFKRKSSESAEERSPQFIAKEAALDEFFGELAKDDAKENDAENEYYEKSGLLGRLNDLEMLKQRVKKTEENVEALIGKMDRVLARLEAMATAHHHSKIARGASSVFGKIL